MCAVYLGIQPPCTCVPPQYCTIPSASGKKLSLWNNAQGVNFPLMAGEIAMKIEFVLGNAPYSDRSTVIFGSAGSNELVVRSKRYTTDNVVSSHHIEKTA